MYANALKFNYVINCQFERYFEKNKYRKLVQNQFDNIIQYQTGVTWETTKKP